MSTASSQRPRDHYADQVFQAMAGRRDRAGLSSRASYRWPIALTTCALAVSSLGLFIVR